MNLDKPFTEKPLRPTQVWQTYSETPNKLPLDSMQLSAAVFQV